MGHPQRVQATDVWILTDIYGRVQAISSEARAALGAPPIGRGDDLVKRFHSRRKALMFDMEVALTGWPTERTIMVGAISRRPLTVRYRVSRWWSTEEIGLFWLFNVAEREERFRA